MPSQHDLEANAQFVRDHFEEFVNRKNSAIAFRNVTPDFLDHGGPYCDAVGPRGVEAHDGR